MSFSHIRTNSSTELGAYSVPLTGRKLKSMMLDNMIPVEREREPGAVHLKGDIDPQLLEAEPAIRTVRVSLLVEGPGIVIGQRPHQLIRLVVLGNVLCVHLVRSPPDAHGERLVLEREILDGASRQRWAAMRVHVVGRHHRILLARVHVRAHVGSPKHAIAQTQKQHNAHSSHHHHSLEPRP